MVNRGYFHVARKARWYWEEASDAFTLNPGDSFISLWPGGTELPYFRSLDAVYVTTAGRQVKLDRLSRDEFMRDWLSQDLTAVQSRGNPSGYYVFEGKLYIVSPPSSATDFIAHYHRRVVPLSDNVKYPTGGYTDVPLTPPHLDEAILKAAKYRAHLRAQEITLANQERADLEEFFDDMKDDEAELMDEGYERVSPDDTWL